MVDSPRTRYHIPNRHIIKYDDNRSSLDPLELDLTNTRKGGSLKSFLIVVYISQTNGSMSYICQWHRVTPSTTENVLLVLKHLFCIQISKYKVNKGVIFALSIQESGIGSNFTLAPHLMSQINYHGRTVFLFLISPPAP